MHLDLSGQNLCNQGKHLAEVIKCIGDDQLFQSLFVRNCSIPVPECAEILEYLSVCRYFTHLDISENTVGSSVLELCALLF